MSGKIFDVRGWTELTGDFFIGVKMNTGTDQWDEGEDRCSE